MAARPSASHDGADKDPRVTMEQMSRLLLSIGPEEAQLLSHTREFRDFVQSVQNLERARRHIRTWHDPSIQMNEDDEGDNNGNNGQSDGTGMSFLQYASDEILLRVLGFLECRSLVSVSSTCVRFWELAKRSARDRTQELVHERQLTNVMQLLRAKEQIEGLHPSPGVGDRNLIRTNVHVRVPVLLLNRQVLLKHAGDPDFNGIYHCTGCNGNGFVFTKPRFPPRFGPRRRRISMTGSLSSSSSSLPAEEALGENDVAQQSNGQLLRCIIAKRFSNETILWYLSKEVVASEDDEENNVRSGDIIQLFSFWAKLMVIGDASPDICRYPSQTSILGRNNRNEGWQSLERTQFVEPPTVELVD